MSCVGLIADLGDYTPAFLTLTVRNVRAGDLRATLRQMSEDWNRFINRPKTKQLVAGWAKALEITYNTERHTFHPHYHVILLQDTDALGLREIRDLVGGLELLALGTWLYMKSALGSGPRDALMVALARKFGRSAGACRAVVDVLVTVIGFFLGGPVGIGTIISAVGLGPLINLNFAAVRFKPAEVHQENAAETIARIAGKR